MKYTSPSAWLYARERVPDAEQQDLDDPDETQRAYTFRAVCRDVAESERFAGRDFSWGDRLIAEAAAGAGEALGDTSKPVAFATSHHLAYLGDWFE